MAGQHPKDLKDYMPALADQGIDNLVASPSRGIGIQVASFTMGSAPDDFVFADNVDIAGNVCQDMADGNYEVLVWNQTDVADQGVISAKTAKQFTITGPDAADVVTLLIIGKIAGQLG